MRDRHNRGIRAMLAPPGSIVGQRLRSQHPTLASACFVSLVTEAITKISDTAPDALTHLRIDIKEVPELDNLWSSHIPLASAVEGDDTHPTQITIYRRPIELRSANLEQLGQLIFAALVEQVATATGLSMSTLDPNNYRGE